VKEITGGPFCRWEDNIKLDVQEVGCEGMDWIELSQVRAIVKTVMNLRVPYNARNFLTSSEPVASQEGLCFME
jgi:hypothetical protein